MIVVLDALFCTLGLRRHDVMSDVMIYRDHLNRRCMRCIMICDTGTNRQEPQAKRMCAKKCMAPNSQLTNTPIGSGIVSGT
mmetsp:Transcript_33798/g.45707  ORF Transcript_33798/g.45707 Transcript_33798/m.45707 type:complete len:81 (+) Transcript_33798:423-665(+)